MIDRGDELVVISSDGSVSDLSDDDLDVVEQDLL